MVSMHNEPVLGAALKKHGRQLIKLPSILHISDENQSWSISRKKIILYKVSV